MLVVAARTTDFNRLMRREQGRSAWSLSQCAQSPGTYVLRPPGDRPRPSVQDRKLGEVPRADSLPVRVTSQNAALVVDGVALGISTKSVSSSARLRGAVSLGEERNWDSDIDQRSPCSGRETVSATLGACCLQEVHPCRTSQTKMHGFRGRCSQKCLKKNKTPNLVKFRGCQTSKFGIWCDVESSKRPRAGCQLPVVSSWV